MPTYMYKGIDSGGHTCVGYLGAENDPMARQQAAHARMDLLSLKKKTFSKGQKKYSSHFFLYLNYALHTKKTLHDALYSIETSFKGLSNDWAMLTRSIADQVCQGHALSRVCALYSIFPDFVPSILNQGEKTATLARACHTCYTIIENQRSEHEALLKSLAYPVMNSLFFIASLCLLCATLVPSANDLFDQENNAKPMALSLLSYCMENGLFVVTGISLACLGIVWTLWKLPGVKKVYFRSQYLSFFSSMHYLIQADISLLDALNALSIEQYSASTYRIARRVLQDIKTGKSFAESMHGLPFLSLFYVQIIGSGNSSQKQKDSLYSVVQIMKYDTKKLLDRIVLWVGPVTVLFLAMGFWLIIYGIFQPLYTHMGALFNG